MDPDELIRRDPELWRRLSAGKGITLCFDGDRAGRIATLRAIERAYNDHYASEQDLRHNGNWVRYMEPYQEYQNTLLDHGVGLHVPQADPASPLERDPLIFTDPKLIKSWPVNRLVASLQRWHCLQEALLFYGNAYLIKYSLGHIEERITELKKELLLRATPQLREHSHAETIKGYWNAAEVRDRIDWFDIYGQLLPDLEPARGDHQYTAACPFHTQDPTKRRTTTLSINTAKGVFFCFSCQASGSGFDFVMRFETLPFAQAVNRVAELGNLQ